jgi:hypothetical protein
MIVDYDVNFDRPVKVFMSNVGYSMFNIFRDLNMVYHMIPYSNGVDVYYRNYFDQIDITEGQEIYQYIDSAGKVRSFVILPTNLILIVPPTQPEAVRTVSMEYISRIPRISYRDVLQYIDQQYLLSIDIDGSRLIGMWFQGDVYTPVQPIDIPVELQHIPVGPSNPLIYTISGVDRVSRYRKLKSDVEVILRVVMLDYILKGRPDVDEYFRNYIDIGDGSVEYNLYMVPDIISENQPLPNNIPTLVHNGKIYLYSPKFAEGVRYYLQRSSMLDVIDISNRVKVSKVYRSNETVIESQSEFFNWIGMVNKPRSIEVATVITQSMSLSVEPYIYQDLRTNYIYLIQNVLPSSEDRITIYKALTIGYYWKNYYINPGVNPTVDENLNYSDMSYVVYGISSSGDLQFRSSVGSEGTYSILDYDNRYYAAVLDIGYRL